MKFPVLSHTLLNDWTNCPHKAFRKYIAKDLPRQPQTDAMKWGNDVHSAFEVRLKHGTPFPAMMASYEPIAQPLAAVGAQAEKMLGINAKGETCDFFAKDVWLRGKVDITVLAKPDPNVGYYQAAIWDLKTGKRREDPTELHIHAVLLRAWRPELVRITAAYIWLPDMQVGQTYDVSRTQETLTTLRHEAEDIARCMDVEDFPKRRNPLCDWCPVFDCENHKNWKRR